MSIVADRKRAKSPIGEVTFIKKNIFPPITPVHEVVDRAWKFHSELSSHQPKHDFFTEKLSILFPDPEDEDEQ